ncbi:hypothetical protein [Streptomyces poriticola]|uniref:hypothetical protein n=1 Tax=Streptomyces poriticola TaxID=3120506 RepID=UPI002FCE0969
MKPLVTDTSEEPVDPHPETGWSEARRRRGTAVPRTCVPAVEDGKGPRPPQPGPEPHIIRGED